MRAKVANGSSASVGKARKRGGKAEKPGLSSEQTPILIARDRHGHHLEAVLPDRSENSVSAVLKQALSKSFCCAQTAIQR